MRFSIALVNFDISWENPSMNIKKLEEMFSGLTQNVDMIVLPEMFLTGFSMGEVAVEMNSPEVEWMKDVASAKNVALLGSLAIKDNSGVFNRALFVKPDKTIEYYDKRHLFRMGQENNFYKSGTKRTVVAYKGITIMPLVCYDLRFPVWCRNKNDYDVLVFMANWPALRQKVWNTLLKARAIENQCFVVGVNRVGHGGGIAYVGGTQAIDYKGEEIVCLGEKKNEIKVIEIDLEKLCAFKEKFPAWQDADEFRICD